MPYRIASQVWSKAHASMRDPSFWLPPVVLCAVVLLANYESYLVAHGIAELFSVLIYWVFFALAWKTQPFAPNRLITIAGCGFFWVGVIDVVHTMAYKDMNLLPIGGGNASTQLWVSARVLQVVSLLTAIGFARRNVSLQMFFAGFGAYAIAIIVLVYRRDLPTTFIEGSGVTLIKTIGEFIIIGLSICLIVFLLKAPQDILRNEDRPYLIYATLFAIASEISLSFYTDLFGSANIIGHMFKIWASWLIFEVALLINLERPHLELQRLSEVIHQSPSMVLLTDANGLIEYVNPQFETDTGYKAGEVLGRDVNMLKSEEMPAKVLEGMWATIRQGQVWHGYFRNKRKDGSLYWDKSTISPIRDGRGKIISYASIKEDVTQKRQVEEFLLDKDNAVAQTLLGSLEAMIGLLEARDPYTAGHSRNVGVIALIIAEELALPRVQVEGLRLAAMVHDIGKIQVPMDILNKPGKLTPSEFDLIKQHPRTAYEALKSIPFPWDVPTIVLAHHEKWDGTGYPNGWRGDAIPLEAQILSVADVLDAVSAHRPYRPKLGAAKAFAIIEQEIGKSFSPLVAGAALRARERIAKVIPE